MALGTASDTPTRNRIVCAASGLPRSAASASAPSAKMRSA